VKTATVPVFGIFTVYHLLMTLLVVLGLLPVLGKTRQFARYALHVMAWFIIEDTTWFICNPHFGLSKVDEAWWFDSVIIISSWPLIIIGVVWYICFAFVIRSIPKSDGVVFFLTLPVVWLLSFIYWPIYESVHTENFTLGDYSSVQEAQSSSAQNKHLANVITVFFVTCGCVVYTMTHRPRPKAKVEDDRGNIRPQPGQLYDDPHIGRAVLKL